MRFPGRVSRAVPALAAVVATLSFAGNTEAGGAKHATVTKVNVTFTDSRLGLIPTGLQAGPTAFVVVNKGTKRHSLAIEGPGLKGAHTPELAPGKSATLTVKLRTGAYMLSFSHPAGLGMAAAKWVQVIPATVVTSHGGSSVQSTGGDTPVCGGAMITP